MRIRFETIDEYIRTFPSDVKAILQNIRDTVHCAAPEATEAISYNMPAFKLNGNLVYFAAFKHHIGFYPTPSGTETFRKEIAPYKHSKGAVQFPLDQPIPYGLIEKIVAFRVKENAQKKK